ncbi:LysM domain-containing protein [Phlyctema vagabunda]|uniref:LysM domain-containing protein n=1 Tax=Phlyctema vagabunda TaxID=108571 RepID=A0ABR4P4W6_9HELO
MNHRDNHTSNSRFHGDGGGSSRSRSPATGTTTTSLRPRNKRLLSTAPEQELVSTSGTSTPNTSRGVSPIPSRHPSRTPTASRDNGRLPVGGLVAPGTSRASSRGTSPAGFGGLLQSGWSNSWTTLQGYANSVLGGDLEGGNTNQTSSNGVSRHRRKVSTNRTQPPPATWGPAGLPRKESTIGEGSTMEREAELRRRKTQGILESHEGMVNGGLDINGRYKRRTSLEDTRTEEEVEDALVYIHPVSKTDTLAGLVLKYNCQPAVFKKANGLWANDAIQVRKFVYLPVDACAIKGRPCEPPNENQSVDLLAPTPAAEEAPDTNGGNWPTFEKGKQRSAVCPENDEDAPWVHVRWVLLDASPSSKPVEIGRMPRRTLGYFPPRRRKSQATLSTLSTPRGSLDVARSPSDRNSSAASTPQRRTSLLGVRPSSGSYFPPPSLPTRPGRPRRESTSEAAERLGWMRGPGGVGTLTGKNVRMPGPAQDSFNAFAKKHIPGLAIDSLPSTSILGSEQAQFGFSDELSNITETPSGVSARSGATTPSGLGLENAAAAVEGFFRRITIKAPSTPRMSGAPGSIESNDLIELLDGAGSDDGRGFEVSPVSSRSNTVGSGREDLEGLVRGRATVGSKAKKSD